MTNSQDTLDQPENNPSSQNENATQQRYGGLADRVKAIIIDTFMMGLMLYISSAIMHRIGDVSDGVKIFMFVFVFVLYDPLFTSLFGATLGHAAMRLQVRKHDDESKKINIIQALIRYGAKYVLGIISVLTVDSNSKSRGIHDLISGSVVIYKKR